MDATRKARFPLKIGTRGSPLALAQTELFKARLAQVAPIYAAPEATEICIIKTTGDKVLDRPLADIGGKGLFAKEIETALTARAIDVAVHSLKDMETHLPKGLMLGAVLPREDARDVLLCKIAKRIAHLPNGASVGTSSIRRQAQLLHLRGDLAIVPLRGNVNSRLRKLEDGAFDAEILAAAGLKRLNFAPDYATPLPIEEFLPAPCQGVIAIECREDDAPMRELLNAVSDAPTAAQVAAERGLLAAVDGSCHTPIGAYAALGWDMIHLRALVATPDGAKLFRAERMGSLRDAEKLGRDAGAELRAAAPAELFQFTR